jgi:hypothetical protein
VKRHSKALLARSNAPDTRLFGRAMLGLALVSLVLGVTLASAAAPSVTVEEAANVGYTTADVEGSVNPEGQSTSWRFQYATQADFSDAVDGPSGSTETSETVSGQLSGLAPGTTYHLRLLAENGDGQSEDVAAGTFETKAAAKPTITEPSVSGVGYTVAHLAAEVTAGGDDEIFNTFCHFEYVRDSSFQASGFAEASWAGCDVEPVTGTSPTEVKADVGGLTPGTLYHVRLVAENANGANRVETEAPYPTFETTAGAAPTATTPSVSDVTGDSAHFVGEVNPNAPQPAPVGDPDMEAAFSTSWHFEYSSDGGASWSAVGGGTVEADNQPHGVEADATGLEPNTNYLVRLVASNGGGSDESPEEGFATEAIGPEIGDAVSFDPTQTAVTLRGTVDPNNSAISECRFLYGTGGALDDEASCESTPAGNGPQVVAARITGLSAGTTYDFKLVASTSAGTAEGDPQTVMTFDGPAPESCSNQARRTEQSNTSPDCRAWEMVSPLDKNGGNILGEGETTIAAADGNAVLYGSRTGFADFAGSGVVGTTQYISRRSPSGWTPHSVTPTPNPVTVQVFFGHSSLFLLSDDLRRGVLDAYDLPYIDGDNLDRANLYSEETETRAIRPITQTALTPLSQPEFIQGTM